MTRSIFFLKLLLDAIRDTHKVCKYFELLKFNNILIYFKLFIIKFFYAFSFIRNNRKISKNINDTECDFFIDEKIKLNNLVKDVDKNGFSEIFTIKENYIESIKNYVLNKENILIKENFSNKNLLMKNPNEEINDYFDRLKKEKISRLTASIDIKKNSVFRDFLFSKFMIEFAKSYLNSNDFSVNATLFISNPLKISEKQKYKNAQYFHWDNDFKKFFKFYIYLSDVDLNSGPHIFIPQTHKTKLKPFKLCRLYSDQNVYKQYNKPKIFTGKTGSSFFTDSYGLHKGETPIETSRLILNIHYGVGKILYSKNDEYIQLNRS